MTLIKSCSVCSEGFKVIPSEFKLRKYCSRECYAVKRGDGVRIKASCHCCGAEINHIRSRATKYCSNDCRIKKLKENTMTEISCNTCGKVMTVLKHLNKKYCSRKCSGKSRRLELGLAGQRMTITQYKQSAKRRNIIWELSDKETVFLFKGDCHWCGIKPSNNSSKYCKGLHGDFIYNGIDRVDNDKGYILSNCVSCCATCNMMKWKLNKDKFLDKIKEIYNKWEAK